MSSTVLETSWGIPNAGTIERKCFAHENRPVASSNTVSNCCFQLRITRIIYQVTSPPERDGKVVAIHGRAWHSLARLDARGFRSFSILLLSAWHEADGAAGVYRVQKLGVTKGNPVTCHFSNPEHERRRWPAAMLSRTMSSKLLEWRLRGVGLRISHRQTRRTVDCRCEKGVGLRSITFSIHVPSFFRSLSSQ